MFRFEALNPIRPVLHEHQLPRFGRDLQLFQLLFLIAFLPGLERHDRTILEQWVQGREVVDDGDRPEEDGLPGAVAILAVACEEKKNEIMSA